MENLKYPIGQFLKPTEISAELLNSYISDIESFPDRLKAEVENLTEAQLDTEYRPDGWTIRQVVHHCADSHINSFTRFKLALTEDNPTIKPYLEAAWAELADSKNMPLAPSLQLLEGLHKRWVVLLKSLSESDLQRTFFHPESKAQVPLAENIGIYAWHCNHHLAHITQLKKQKAW